MTWFGLDDHEQVHAYLGAKNGVAFLLGAPTSTPASFRFLLPIFKPPCLFAVLGAKEGQGELWPLVEGTTERNPARATAAHERLSGAADADGGGT